jgi:NitT/TauT family transport system substrate-binding protein
MEVSCAILCRTLPLALLTMVLAILAATCPGPVRAADADQTIRVSVNPGIYNNLPIFLAADKGYFADQHLNVVITKINQSAATIIPLLARGDIDLTPVVMSPAFFNQYSQGFNLKVLASLDSEKAGWSDVGYLMVRQDLWDSGAVRKLADLRGKTIDGVALGAPVDFIARIAIQKGGLTLNDVNFGERFHDAATVLQAWRNKAVDVMVGVEPNASQLQAEGLAHKWMPQGEIVPWFQNGYISASTSFLRDHREAVVRFLAAYVRAQREIAATNGKWTPDLIAEVVKWSGQPEEIVKTIPGPAYTGALGAIDAKSIDRQQQVWLNLKVVSKAVPISQIIDRSPLQDAYRLLGIKK